MDVQHTLGKKRKLHFNAISMNESLAAGPPFSLLWYSSVEIRNCLIIACLNGAGHLNCAKGRVGR